MRSVIQEISLDLKTGVSDVTVGAPKQISLQDSIDRSRQLAEALRRTAWADSSTSSGEVLRAEDPAAEALPERTMKSRSFPASGRP